MIVLIGTFRLPAGNAAEAHEAMARIIAASRAEAGCISYGFGEDVLEPGLFQVSEMWTDEAALAAHFASPHMAQWRREREALGMTERNVVAYGVSGEVRV